MKISVKELRKAIEAVQAEKRRGTFFSVIAKTRKEGEMRRFNCHFGYAKYKVGGQMAYDPIEKNLLVVWDQKAYHKYKKGEGRTPIRSINCNNIWKLQVCGVSLIQDGKLTEAYKQYKQYKSKK